MTNVNLSYAREVLRYKFTGEDDFQERNVRISIFRRPVGKGEKGLGQNPQLPNVSFCMHWGVWVEFDGTKEGLGRCIYTFDADIHKKDNVDLCKSTDWSTHLQALFAGDFTVTGFEFFPDLKVQKNSKYATKHPYEDEIIHNEDYVVGRVFSCPAFANRPFDCYSVRR